MIFLYTGLFVPVWWVWNQFTWYASHFDNDDVFFRILMLSGIMGTLVLAGGITGVILERPFQFIYAYVFLHILKLFAWLRALLHIREFRAYIIFKTIGVIVGILMWALACKFGGDSRLLLCGLGTLLQLLMPIFSWLPARRMISVHYHHLMERHGVFAIVVMGESLLALSGKFSDFNSSGIALQGTLCLIIIVSIWWIYFDWDYNPHLFPLSLMSLNPTIEVVRLINRQCKGLVLNPGCS